MYNNYLIKYFCYNSQGGIIKNGTMRAKNKLSGVAAQADFEKYLKNKYTDFGRLVVTSCREETYFDDIFDMLNKF